MFGILKKLVSGGAATDYKKLVREGALIVDVRTAAEFSSGHIKGSLNIPLDQVKNKIADLQQKNKPVITCCRSGARSGVAKGILKSAGIDCYNGGAWDVLAQSIK